MTDVQEAAKVREITTGLQFPEGPVAMSDGSVVLVEIKGGRISRVSPDGKTEVVAETGGGPNGSAIGPDGKLYVANNGGSFSWHDIEGLTIPGPTPDTYEGGRIERVDLDSGEVDVLYRDCDGNQLRGPNDLVFDRDGGFWFTDHGTHGERQGDVGGVYYAKPDGSQITEAIWGLNMPNGIGLSPDGGTLYVAETFTGRLWSWPVKGPGEVEPALGLVEHGGTLVAGLPGLQLFDSLGVDAEGNVCVATIIVTGGGITSISPDGENIELTECGDPLTTNICWGGDDRRTAFITCSATGRLVSVEWPRPGLELAYNA
jgi:gluconolactonase